MILAKDAATELIQLARTAGDAILKIYAQPALWSTDVKSDESPVTAADLAAHQCLMDGLPQILKVPVLSEELSEDQLIDRHHWPIYWLVDPLDGTREFLARNGEFTVNIALIIHHQPVIGLIHQPTTDTTYLGVVAENPLAMALCASKWVQGKFAQSLKVQSTSDNFKAQKQLRVLVSHRHGLAATEHLLQELSKTLNCSLEQMNVGSALKFALLAEGRADLYPRLAPTSEWDTAAGQALLRAMGGDIVSWPDLIPLNYNTKNHLLNPHFLALADASFNWQDYCSQF